MKNSKINNLEYSLHSCQEQDAIYIFQKKRLSKDEPANVDESNQSDDDVDSRLSEYEDFIDFFLDSESESIKNKRMDNALFKTSESKVKNNEQFYQNM